MNAMQKLINAAKVKRRVIYHDEFAFHERVPTNSEVSRIMGRNGTFEIPWLQVEQWSKNCVQLDGVGKRGETIMGGIIVTPECFEEMCRRYLLRGLEE